MGISEVSTSVVKCSEDLSNRMSIIIRRYVDQMKFVAGMAVSFITFFSYSSGSVLYHCIYGCMFCMLLFNSVNYVFLLLCLCILIVVYVPFWVFCVIVLFCVLFVCKCVLYYRHRVSTQLQLTNISHHIIYHIIYHIISSYIISYIFSYHIISYHTIITQKQLRLDRATGQAFQCGSPWSIPG